MKKTKLLTSIAALALVVGLGACEVNVEVGDVDVNVNPSEDTSEDETTSESTSEDESTGESSSEGTSPSESSSEGGSTGEDEEAKKKAADLEEVQEALKGLGTDPFTGWEAYKYVLTEDEETETRLLATDSNGNLIGYSAGEEMTTYYLDGVAYVDFDGEYFTEEVESYETVSANLDEDGWFVSGNEMAIETILDLTVEDVSSITIADNTYTVSYETFEDQYVLGTMTYKYTTTFVIDNGALISAKSESSQIHTAGTVGEGDYTKEVCESIEKVDPQTVTQATLIEAGFDATNWEEGEDETAEIVYEILASIQGSTPEWEAFYGDVTTDEDDAYTEYLTTDPDGNLYGYRYDWDDWEEVGTEFWYYGGYKCMYSYSGHQAQTPGEVYTTYEDELESFTYSLTISFDLSSDPYTLTQVDDGYELTIAKSTTYYNTYTFTVDTSYNLVAIDVDAEIGSQNDGIAVGHIEGITYADVEAFIGTTSFDPADFGFGTQEEDPDLEIAEAILDAVNEGISWDAFHGEYIDEGYDERETVYLTEDEDGMYGSIIDTEDDEVTFAYYYQDGKEYEYAANRNAYEVDDQWEDYSDHLDEYIEEQLDGAEDFDLDSDTYELKEYDDGYELIFTTNFMGYYDYEYIYIVDEDFNVTALAYGEYFAGDLEGWYAEETTYDKVAASMEDFDPSDWGEEEQDPVLKIALSILEWAAETDEYDIPGLWDAVHIDDIEYDWDEEDEYWITIQDDALYGRFEQSGIEDTSYSETRYFMNNYYFSIQNDDDEISYDYDTYYEDYEDIIDAYTYPIADAENFLDEDDDGNLIISEDVYSYELTENSDGGYTLKIIYGDWWGRDSATIYTYTTDENLDVYKIEYEEGSIEEEDYEYNLLEWITEDEVESKMSDFDISLWIN